MNKHKETRQLAHDCVTMCLHGPVPMKTTAKLAQGVMELYDENERLQTKVRELEERIRGM